MSFQACPNTVAVTLIGDLAGELAVNDMAFTLDPGPPTSLDVNDITVAISEWWRDSMCPLLDHRYYFMQAVGRDLTSEGSYRTVIGYGTFGGVAGDAAPNNVTFCISFKSGLAGRAGNGRNFLPGIPLSYLSGNYMNDEPLAALLAVYYPLLVGGEGVLPTGWKWVVVSRRVGGVLRPVAFPFGVNSVVATDTSVDSQRRRLPGRGR